MDIAFQIDDQAIVREMQEQLRKRFEAAAIIEVREYFSESYERSNDGTFKKVAGVGLLQIRELLEKKFDDPKTQQRMEEYFEANFERIMNAAMEKALQHKANAFVFGKTKNKREDNPSDLSRSA